MNPSSLTIEEAVARMVNMDYIPTGFSLVEMTDAFREDAEVEYENGQIERLQKDEINKLKLRMEACRIRHDLAQSLTNTLNEEIKRLDDSMLVLADEKSSVPRLTLESVAWWASDRFGIGIPEWEPETTQINNGKWEDVTIKIYKDNMIGYSIKKGTCQRKSFREIGLMGEKGKRLNQQGAILIGLSKRKKYPAGQRPKVSEKTAISKLRTCLKRLTGISDDPFFRTNPTEGWIPKFTLIDDRRNADERAKRKSKHCSLDEKMQNELYGKDIYNQENELEAEAPDFKEEGDDAGQFLQNQKKGYLKPSK